MIFGKGWGKTPFWATRFAWLPVQLVTGRWVWLEPYRQWGSDTSRRVRFFADAPVRHSWGGDPMQ